MFLRCRIVKAKPHCIADDPTDHHRLSSCFDIDQSRCINRSQYHAIAVCDDVSVLDINMSQPLPVSSSDLEASLLRSIVPYSRPLGIGTRQHVISSHASLRDASTDEENSGMLFGFVESCLVRRLV